MIPGEWIRPGATVIDVGINRVPFDDPVKAAEGKTKLVGDVDFKTVNRDEALTDHLREVVGRAKALDGLEQHGGSGPLGWRQAFGFAPAERLEIRHCFGDLLLDRARNAGRRPVALDHAEDLVSEGGAGE